MIDVNGELVRDTQRLSLPNSWGNHEIYRCPVDRLCVVHNLCTINLDTGAETISSMVTISKGGLLYILDSKIGYAINVCHAITMPVTVREGDSLTMRLWASAADTPVAVTFQGMEYKTR